MRDFTYVHIYRKWHCRIIADEYCIRVFRFACIIIGRGTYRVVLISDMRGTPNERYVYKVVHICVDISYIHTSCMLCNSCTMKSFTQPMRRCMFVCMCMRKSCERTPHNYTYADRSHNLSTSYMCKS